MVFSQRVVFFHLFLFVFTFQWVQSSLDAFSPFCLFLSLVCDKLSMVRAVLTVFPAEMRFFLPSRAFCCYPLVYRIVERNAIKEFIFSVCLSFTIAVHSSLSPCRFISRKGVHYSMSCHTCTGGRITLQDFIFIQPPYAVWCSWRVFQLLLLLSLDAAVREVANSSFSSGSTLGDKASVPVPSGLPYT